MRHPQFPRIRAPRPVPAGVLGRSRVAALVAIAVLVAAASLTSFAESYRGLYDWATRHGLHGLWAVIWPLQVDVFIAVGELALFVGLAYGWDRRSRAGAWLVTAAGLAVSVAGNVGHVASHLLADRATAAVPPLAAASALAVGLGVLKRVVGHRVQAAPAVPVVYPELSPRSKVPDGLEALRAWLTGATAPVPDVPAALNGHGHAAVELFAADIAAGQVPGIRAIKSGLGVGQPVAQQVQAYLRTVARTSGVNGND